MVVRFDCDQPDEDKAAAQIHDGVLVPGLRALEERFGTWGRDRAWRPNASAVASAPACLTCPAAG